MTIKNNLFYDISVLLLIYVFLQGSFCAEASEVPISTRNQYDYSNKIVIGCKLAPKLAINQVHLKEAL